MLRSGWLLHWLNHGQHLTAIAAYRYEISAGADTNVYLFMLIWFPVIGLVISALGVASTPLGGLRQEHCPRSPPRPVRATGQERYRCQALPASHSAWRRPHATGCPGRPRGNALP